MAEIVVVVPVAVVELAVAVVVLAVVVLAVVVVVVEQLLASGKCRNLAALPLTTMWAGVSSALVYSRQFA